MTSISKLTPMEVFKHFSDICSIPHGSGDTDKINAYCAEFAKKRKLWHTCDKFNNIIIKKPATPGYESAPPLILQGHLDMVCEKDDDIDFDFKSNPLDVFCHEGFVRARGTTLGGDDGIAVAYILAVLDSSDIPHPAIEAVLTSDEETGMYGAKGLDTSLLTARRMLNIDSEEEGIFTVSCAGGETVKITMPVNTEAMTGFYCKLTLGNLTGGHSGVEIHKHRANANKILAMLIKELNRHSETGIINFHGGLKTNAIPAFAEAELITRNDMSSLIPQIFNDIKNQYAKTDSGMSLSFETSAGLSGHAMPASCITELIERLPDGVIKMNDTIEALPETSANIGITQISDGNFEVYVSVRSSKNASKAELTANICRIAKDFNGGADVYGTYPAWEYMDKSPLRAALTDVYTRLYGSEPKIMTIHAGLECGIFASKIEGLDCVSIGPDIFDIHTPRERLSISSVQRTWELIKELLRTMKE